MIAAELEREVVALNYLVKAYGGTSPAERLNQHLIELMKRKSAARARPNFASSGRFSCDANINAAPGRRAARYDAHNRGCV